MDTNNVVNIDPQAVNEVLLKRYSNSQMEVIQLEAYVTQLEKEKSELLAEVQRLQREKEEANAPVNTDQ